MTNQLINKLKGQRLKQAMLAVLIVLPGWLKIGALTVTRPNLLKSKSKEYVVSTKQRGTL